MAAILEVRLGSHPVGTLTNLAGDYNLFSFDESYIEDENRPTLSQAFIASSGRLVNKVSRTHRVAPAFFANLLPEADGILRQIIARQFAINATRDFPYLQALGGDLPGAVTLVDVEAGATEKAGSSPTPVASGERPLRFSLAGVQLKFSASLVKNRFTVPATGLGGNWIVKLPTNTFPRLPENEFAVMSIARAVGLPVPDTKLLDLQSLEGLPENLPAVRRDEPAIVYAISRFDRAADGTRVHVEDFNQIADQQPAEKYERRSSSWIANVLATLCPSEDVDDFVRRLVFGVCVGNDDMHLKNWAVVYPNGRDARIAPMYDFVCTRSYFPNGELALTIGGEREFERIGFDALDRFARDAEVSAKHVRLLAREMAEAIRGAWPAVRASIEDPDLLQAIDTHFARMPLMRA